MSRQTANSPALIVFPLWVTLFCFTVIVGLLFQKVILPNMPSMHGGHGLMNLDAIYFHQVAIRIAENIQANGWTWDTIRIPDYAQSSAGGQVIILGGLYAAFGVDPTLILPINALLHASSGILIFLIVQLLCPGQIGRVFRFAY